MLMKAAPKRRFYHKIITFRSYFYAFYGSFVFFWAIIHKMRLVWGGGAAASGGEGQQRRCRRAKLRRSAAVIKRHVPLPARFSYFALISTLPYTNRWTTKQP